MIKNMKKLMLSYEYKIPVLLTLFLSYAFYVTHIAIGVDYLCSDRYVNQLYFIYQGRYLCWLLGYITSRGGHKCSFFPTTAVGVLLFAVGGLIIAAVLLELLRDIDERMAVRACSFFSCLYISYPLICEGFAYDGLVRVIGFGVICCVTAWYLIYKTYREQSVNIGGGGWLEAAY